ncbi:MAG: SDR family oxidoreductase, partial [Pseudomonadota bacterium]
IRVNAVAPGFIDTRMALMEDGTHEHDIPAFRKHYIEGGRIPLRRPGTPTDCAGSFVFLASNLSLYISGQAIAVDGGLSATY